MFLCTAKFLGPNYLELESDLCFMYSEVLGAKLLGIRVGCMCDMYSEAVKGSKYDLLLFR